MKGTSRRGILGVLAAYGATVSATKASAAAEKLDPASVKRETDIACLYHCDFGDSQRFSQLLTNVNNHLSVYEFDPFKIKIVLVAHGPGIKFFLNDLTGTPWEKERVDPELYQRFTGLTKFSVEAYLC
jgi:intracellular sulfur oxidation DsrE/DsrF family protein